MKDQINVFQIKLRLSMPIANLMVIALVINTTVYGFSNLDKQNNIIRNSRHFDVQIY